MGNEKTNLSCPQELALAAVMLFGLPNSDILKATDSIRQCEATGLQVDQTILSTITMFRIPTFTFHMEMELNQLHPSNNGHQTETKDTIICRHLWVEASRLIDVYWIKNAMNGH